MKINLTNNKINLPRLKTCFSGRICEVIEENDKNICEIKTAKYIVNFPDDILNSKLKLNDVLQFVRLK